MKRKIWTKLIMLLVVMGSLFALSGCGGDDSNTLYVYNWGDYIGKDVIKMFTEETGIKVKYDMFDTNEAMYTKIKNSGGGYDVLFPSDYMIERMINEDMLEKIDMNNVPNFVHIDDQFKNLSYDPQNEYSVAYTWGVVGILYNTDMVKEPVDSWNVLWDKQYEKQIFMYDSQRDSLGLALKRLGYSLNTRDINELEAARDSLIEQRPLAITYLGDDIKNKMIGNEAALAVVYSGDAMYCQMQNDKLAFAVPKEGTNIFFDGMVIPKGAKHKEAAEKFIDFMSRPEISALNSLEIGYTTANKDALEFVTPEVRDNPTYWPDTSEKDKFEIFYDLGDFKKEFDNAWNDIFIKN